MKSFEATVAAALAEIADQPRGGPPLSAPALWRAGRRRRTFTWTAGSAGLVAVAALLLGIGSVLGPSRSGEPVTVVPAALATSIEFRQVSTIDAGPCSPGDGGLTDGSGETCYHVGGTGLSISRVRSLQLERPEQGQPSLVIRFLPDDAARFATLTRAVAGRRPPTSHLAVIVNGVVVSAPIVVEPITGDTVMISSGSAAETDRLYRSLLPARTSPTP